MAEHVLLVAKQTCITRLLMSASDPKRPYRSRVLSNLTIFGDVHRDASPGTLLGASYDANCLSSPIVMLVDPESITDTSRR